MRRRVRRFVSLAGLGLLAMACSAHRQLAKQAGGFDLTAEKAQNEMLLLNVLRSKDWLLIYLLVQRVEVGEAGKPVEVLRNHPDSDDPEVQKLQAFAQWVQRDFLSRGPEIEDVPVAVSIGPELSAAQVADLEKLVALAK